MKEEKFTIASLRAEVASLNDALINLGWVHPDCAVWVDCNRVLIKLAASDPNGGTGLFKTFADPGFINAMRKAWKEIRAMTSIEDSQKAEWITQLAKLIDRGRELGVEEDLINPLTDAMKALSENIITKQ